MAAEDNLEFKAAFDKWKVEKLSVFCRTKCNRTCCNLAELSIMLSEDELEPVFGKVPETLPEAIFHEGKNYYTFYLNSMCPQYDVENKICKIYDKRPEVCKLYPFKEICDNGILIRKGCELSWKDQEFKDLFSLGLKHHVAFDKEKPRKPKPYE